jgi:hypothetical protein
MSKTLSRPRCRLQLDTLEDRLAPTADMVLQWNDAARDAIRTAIRSPIFPNSHSYSKGADHDQ